MVDVTLTQNEYERLAARSAFLAALFEAGIEQTATFTIAKKLINERASAEAVTESIVTTSLIGAHTD